MDRFQSMQLFTRIVELGSFTRAAEDLQLPRASVTLAVQDLEKRVGTRLLQRTTRHVSTTPDGQAYYERCQRLLAAPVPAIPCMAAYALAVADPAATRQHLTANRIAFTDAAGAMLVDGGPALGAQIAFVADGAKAPWD